MSRIALVLMILGLAIPQKTAQKQTNLDLDKIYADESHCLTGLEIRSERDNPVSCYCRDAIVDARYVNDTYVLSEKDLNLKGTFLTLKMHANEMCKDKESVLEADTTWVYKAIDHENWQWNGPEVTRKYPSNAEIERIKPDTHNVRTVPFKVTLTYHDSQGRIVKTDTFAAHELEPVRNKNVKKSGTE